MSRSALVNIFLFLAILIFFSCTYYHELLFMWPRGIHDWAQADRLSLAISFYDHGMNFFLPRTHNVYSVDGITGVEFPIQAYIAALAAKIFGREHISTLFRLADLLIGYTGLLFLFLAVYRANKDFIFSIVPPLFMFCSPIYIYYTCNYLPDAAACSITFIAFYFVLGYIQTSAQKHLIAAIALLTLAGLIKTSVALYLFGFIGYVFIQRLLRRAHFSRRDNIVYVLGCVLSIGLLAFYYFYNQYLNEKYHSTVFLAKANPFKDWAAVSYYFNASFKYLWLYEYFVLPQYVMLAAIIVPATLIQSGNTEGKKKLLMTALFFAGVVAVGYLMGGQLLIHDYYAVSIFLPFFAFVLLISIIAIHKAALFPQGRRSMRIAMVSATLIIFFFADHHIHQRLKPDYKDFDPGIPWAENGHILMDQLRIPKQERIAVLNEDAPNIALLYLDRRGYTIPAADWQYDARKLAGILHRLNVKTLACEEQFGRSLGQYDTAFSTRFQPLAFQDRVAVFRLKN